MKITTVFLMDKNNKRTKIHKRSSESYNFNISYFLAIICIFLVAIFVLTKVKINAKILNFATNFRQAEDEKFEAKNLVAVYNIFNEKNYVMEKSKENFKDIDTKNTKMDNKTNYEKIDALANKENIEEVFLKFAPTIDITENSKKIQRISINNMKILNYSTKREIDFNGLLSKNINLAKKSDKVLIYNTHTSETYANSEKYKFEYTGTSRTTDANYNMLCIAKELNNNLLDKGISPIQNTTPHDYGTYTSAYSKSRITVKEALHSLGGAGISIDVHRDASSNLDFRPIVTINGVQVAQLMFVMGVGSDTTKNMYYEDNLALAIKIQHLANKIYPGLFRSMIIRNSVYNQDLNKYSLLVEVGATGNTIDEAKLATRCLTNLLNIIYKD
ncbi:MAG: stage II sporulation protein P [Clostridia bacterium]